MRVSSWRDKEVTVCDSDSVRGRGSGQPGARRGGGGGGGG